MNITLTLDQHDIDEILQYEKIRHECKQAINKAINTLDTTLLCRAIEAIKKTNQGKQELGSLLWTKAVTEIELQPYLPQVN